ncbi:ATP-binding protein [Bizionia paragorgiae]|uniref:ATP-binding protein n=1 Tax=Bizionia paragorgiae TaxID=283786 RepID=UPI003A8E6190
MKNIRHTNTSIFGCLLQKYCQLIILLLIGASGFSQQPSAESNQNIESMLSSISEQLQGTITDSIQFRNSMFRVLTLAKQTQNNAQLIKAYHNLATWHTKNPTLDSTIYYLDQAEKISKTHKLPLLEAETFLKKETAYKQRGLYGKAMTENFKALESFEAINNQLGIAKSYTRLCDLLYFQEKYAEGAEYCQKAITILKELNDPKELAKSYRYKADNLLILERYDDALNDINNSISLLKNAGSGEPELARNYNTRGNIYKYMKRYDDAITEYKKCLEIAKKHNLSQGIIPALGNIGHVYRLQEKHSEALPYTLDAIDLMKKSGNTPNLKENYAHTSGSYEALEQYKEALKYEQLYSEARVKELEQIIEQLESELQIKYESAKKDETIESQDATIDRQRKTQLLYISLAALLGIILFGMYFTIRNIRKKRKALALLNKELANKQHALAESNNKLKHSLNELKATQSQLIQSEKLASLGQLAAGIAHEIKNPLNFVNNFSELNLELIDEIHVELEKVPSSPEKEDIIGLLEDVVSNQKKIHQHGTRADSIVKSMLLHSRGGNGIKEPTDINAMLKEYINLSFHAMRAGKKAINVTLDFQLDDTLKKPAVIMEDVSRVILNLSNNAFDAMYERIKDKDSSENYHPKLTVRTYEDHQNVVIEVEDNGNGIPQDFKDKILMPFFTTKRGTEGTGLGLSISNDIVKSHGGHLQIDSKQGDNSFTKFKIILPI